jgi:Soluble lytic murein transglycosylase and related regulatory proteins (some contain LysM/invasin domains)
MNKRILPIVMILGFILSSCAKPAASAPNTDSAQNTPNSPTAVQLPTPTPTPLPATDLSNGEGAFTAGDYDTALAQLNAAKNTTDSAIQAEATLYIGRIALQRQDYQTAISQLGNLVNSQPSGDARNRAFFFLAQSYEGLQEYQQAADAYKNYLDQVPNTPLKSDILVMQGDDLTSAGNNSAALAAYQAALPLAQPEYQDTDAIKVAKATAASGDIDSAITQYQNLYNSTSNNFTKSSANFLLGQLYLQKGDTQNAYARFQDSVAQFPSAYDTYSGLVALVDANQPVDDLLRGIVDYYAGQYGMAISSFDRYMSSHPKHDATVNYYKALSYYNMGNYENEVAEWDKLIQNYPTDAYYAEAFIEKATTQWNKLHEYGTAAQTLLAYVAQAPTSDKAASYLYAAGRIYEQGNLLERAAITWQRVTSEYPAYEKSSLAQFNAGICYYRLGDYAKALVTFQRNALLNSNASDKARAEMWIGKTQQKLNQKDEAKKSFQQAAGDDPTGYYSIRANELLNGQAPFTPSSSIDLGIDLSKEKADAVDWMHSKFSIPADVDLLTPGDLANNVLYQRGDAFWELGMTVQAQSEFESLRQQLTTDAANSFRLMNHLLDLNINQTAILCARQILDIVGLGDATMLDQTPVYFDHVRFGVFFRDIIVPAAYENGLDSLAVFSIIRQESLFEPEVSSSQGATGLMQIMPSVGKEIVTDYNWPANYLDSDLTRPYINVKLGTHYLTKWYSYFDNNMIAALAAYNGGIGYTLNWVSLAGDDPDLLLEVIPDNFETQDYIRQIRENFEIYKTIYTRK